jgi:hypothetical protein
MRCILALCLLCTLVVPAAAAERAPRPSSRQWRKLEHALARYCRARSDDDDCREIVAAMRKPRRVQLTWRGDLLEVLDVAHPRFEDHASVARLRRDKHHWVVVAVTGVYAATL